MQCGAEGWSSKREDAELARCSHCETVFDGCTTLLQHWLQVGLEPMVVLLPRKVWQFHHAMVHYSHSLWPTSVHITAHATLVMVCCIVVFTDIRAASPCAVNWLAAGAVLVCAVFMTMRVWPWAQWGCLQYFFIPLWEAAESIGLRNANFWLIWWGLEWHCLYHLW